MSQSIVRYATLQIQISELCQPFVTVPQWEAAVLVAVHGDNVIPRGNSVVERELPEAGDEFTRLAIRYGPKNSDTPYVAGVYGNFGPGVNALGREIENSITTRAQVAAEARERAEEVAAVAQAAAKQLEAEALAVAAAAAPDREKAAHDAPLIAPAGAAASQSAPLGDALSDADAEALQNLTAGGPEGLLPAELADTDALTEADVQSLVS